MMYPRSGVMCGKVFNECPELDGLLLPLINV